MIVENPLALKSGDVLTITVQDLSGRPNRVKIAFGGGDMDQKLRLTVRVSIYQEGYGGPITIEESLELPAAGFLEMAKILGQFHDLAARIRAGQPAEG